MIKTGTDKVRQKKTLDEDLDHVFVTYKKEEHEWQMKM